MRNLKAQAGTTLAATGLLDQWHTEKLRALGVTTPEALFGLIQADPEATSQFLEVHDLAGLQNEALPHTEAQLMSAMDEFLKPDFALGAEPPDDVEVEERASPETFQKYVAQYSALAAPAAEAEDDGIDITDCFPPIRNQEKRGTCVAHASVAMMECLLGRREEPQHDLSEQWLYWLCKERDGIPQKDGTLINIAMQACAGDGVCLEETWPYNPQPTPGSQGQGPPPPGAQQDASTRTMASFDELAYRSSDAIKAALDEKLPVAIGVPVYDNWYSNPNVNATGEIAMPLPLSRLRGGHAMCVAGYDYDPEVAGGAGFIVRNSWGTGWAPRSAIAPGYGVLPFPYVEQYGWGAFVLR